MKVKTHLFLIILFVLPRFAFAIDVTYDFDKSTVTIIANKTEYEDHQYKTLNPNNFQKVWLGSKLLNQTDFAFFIGENLKPIDARQYRTVSSKAWKTGTLSDQKWFLELKIPNLYKQEIYDEGLYFGIYLRSGVSGEVTLIQFLNVTVQKGLLAELKAFRLRNNIPEPKFVYSDDQSKTPTPNQSQPNNQRPQKSQANQLIPVSFGTGFFVSKNGHIVTNAHVSLGCKKVTFENNGKTEELQILAEDKVNDLAILKSTKKVSRPIKISPESGFLSQDIFVYGFPFGFELSSGIKVTSGVVSSLSGISNNFSNMQIDAAIQPGNSGGPIVDEYGELVGVAVAKVDYQYILDRFKTLPENTNFGIKSSVVENLLKSLDVVYINGDASLKDKRKIAKHVADNTIALDCWSTREAVQEFSREKVFFLLPKE